MIEEHEGEDEAEEGGEGPGAGEAFSDDGKGPVGGEESEHGVGWWSNIFDRIVKIDRIL